MVEVLRESAVPVVRVDQFHVLAKLRLSMVFTVVEAVSAEKADVPPAAYCGMFSTLPLSVAAPLLPEVVREMEALAFPEYGPPPLKGPLSACAAAPSRQMAAAIERKRGM